MDKFNLNYHGLFCNIYLSQYLNDAMLKPEIKPDVTKAK